MIRAVLATICALALSGCALFSAPAEADFDTTAEYQEAVEDRQQRLEHWARVSDVTKQIYQSQIEQWRAAGVDVQALDADQQTYARLACGTMAALTEAVKAMRETQPEAEVAEAENALSDEALDWCLEAVTLLGPAPPPT